MQFIKYFAVEANRAAALNFDGLLPYPVSYEYHLLNIQQIASYALPVNSEVYDCKPSIKIQFEGLKYYICAYLLLIIRCKNNYPKKKVQIVEKLKTNYF